MADEHFIQKQIQKAAELMPGVQLFRANVAKGFLCHKFVKPNGATGFTKPRWFDTGLPVGFPDLCGYRSIIITPEMVGKRIAHFTAIECKSERGKPSAEQLYWHHIFRADGALTDFCRSLDDFSILVEGRAWLDNCYTVRN